MKKLFTIICLLNVMACAAQTISKKAETEPTVCMPVYFIDSVKMDSVNNFIKYIQPDSITKLNVDKSTQFPNGAVYVTLKNHQQLLDLMNDKQLSLQNIADANLSAKQKGKAIIYVLDGDIVTDTTHIRIPAKQLFKITVTDAAQVPSFRKALPNVVLIKLISIRPPLRIRGNEMI